MNIHFKDLELFNSLKRASIGRFVIGSHLYEIANEQSDIDYLYIYVPSLDERNTFKPSHHQLQFKEDGTDHNFVNIFTFLQNLLNGDSPINFELIHSTQLLGTPLEYLYTNRKDFYSYKIIRAFNGFARRDINEIQKVGDVDKRRRKLCHALRGYYFTKLIIEGKELFLNLNTEGINEPLSYYKTLNDYNDLKFSASCLLDDIEYQRKHLIDIPFNKGSLAFPMYMTVENQKSLDAWLSTFIASEEYRTKSNWNMDLTNFYELNENNIIHYEKN